jgi:DNA uptake protein ComE-like DNA-binding protein
MTARLVLVALALGAISCRPAPDDATYGGIWKPSSLTAGGTWSGVTFTAVEATAALDMANTATLSQLDDEISLDSRAAKAIVADRPITAMDDLDLVPYVGASALKALRAYVPQWTGQPGQGTSVTQSGVSFSAAEVTILLDLVNKAKASLLDDDVGLDSRAAKNIVAARPIKTVAALDTISYVGGSALKLLKAYLPSWGTPPPPPPAKGGTYDGVTFSAKEEITALEIANKAHASQLKAGGVSASPRAIIVKNRPWATMGTLAAFSGVGPSTIKALQQMVAGWTGPANPPAKISVASLAQEAATKGSASAYFGQVVAVSRAIITSKPSKRSSGAVSFWIADPSAGDLQQLQVQISASAGLNTAYASIFDDVALQGVFTTSGSIYQIAVSDPAEHTCGLNKSGLPYDDYLTVQAAWKSTSAHPEGAVRVSSDFGYVFMVPLSLFLDHPMWGGAPPSPPKQSGNVQDLAWNAAAQQKLNAYRQANGL